jgi:hypothetical protein
MTGSLRAMALGFWIAGIYFKIMDRIDIVKKNDKKLT